MLKYYYHTRNYYCNEIFRNNFSRSRAANKLSTTPNRRVFNDKRNGIPNNSRRTLENETAEQCSPHMSKYAHARRREREKNRATSSYFHNYHPKMKLITAVRRRAEKRSPSNICHAAFDRSESGYFPSDSNAKPSHCLDAGRGPELVPLLRF